MICQFDTQSAFLQVAQFCAGAMPVDTGCRSNKDMAGQNDMVTYYLAG